MLRFLFSLALAVALLLGSSSSPFISLGAARVFAQGTPPVEQGQAAPLELAPSLTPQPETAILNPLSGQALRGTVAIAGRLPSPAFQAAELDFGYPGDPTGTWFLIAEFDAPQGEGVLAQWDTTTISDGIYTLRLLVTRTDGSYQEVQVPGVRVRNYTPIETDTPAPILPTVTLQPGNTPQPTPTRTGTPARTPIPSTATQLPPNPGILSLAQIEVSFGRGVVGVIGFFALLGIYATVRRLSKPKD